MVNFDEVMTFTEAAEKWGLADGKTIRKAVERGRFEPHEIKKSGNVWLTCYDAMCRVFGEPKKEMEKLYYHDLMKEENPFAMLSAFYQKAEQAIERGEMVCITESREHPERILTIIKTKEELESNQRRMQFVNKTWYKQQ